MIIRFSFSRDPATKPFMIFTRYREMPNHGPTLIFVALYFSAKEVGWAKPDFGVGTNFIDKGSKVVIHNVIAVPTAEKHRL